MRFQAGTTEILHVLRSRRLAFVLSREARSASNRSPDKPGESTRTWPDLRPQYRDFNTEKLALAHNLHLIGWNFYTFRTAEQELKVLQPGKG